MAIANHLDAHVMGASFVLTPLILPRHAYDYLYLAGGYEFLMENCTSVETYSCGEPHFGCGARSRKG